MAEDKNTAVNIGIGIKADTSGAKQAADALDKTAKAAKNAGAGSKEAADLSAALGEKGAEAKDVFEGLTAAQNLNAASAFGLAKAWQNLSAAFAANPIGAIAAALLAVAPAVFALIERLTEVDKSLYGTGERTRKLAEDMEKMKEATEKAMKAIAEGARTANEEYTALNETIDNTQKRFAKIFEANVALQNAKLDLEEASALAGAKTDEERATIKRDFDQRRSATKIATDKDRNTEEERTLNERLNTAKQARSAAAKKIDQSEMDLWKAEKNYAAEILAGKIEVRTTHDLEARRAALKRINDAKMAFEKAQKLRDETLAREGPNYDKANKDVMDTQASLDANRIQKRTLDAAAARSRISANTENQIASQKTQDKQTADALKDLVSILSSTLKGDTAGAKQERFSPDNFDSPEARERKRAEADARNQSRTSALNIARAKASSIVSQLGDGKNDQTEAAELIKVLERISVLLNNPTRSRQYQELLGRMQQLESRLSNNRSM